MKKFNYNIILFASAALLILAGWCSNVFPLGIKNAVADFIEVRDVDKFISDVDSVSQDVWYKNSLIDLNSIFYRGVNTLVVEKTDATVVKLENDYISFVPEVRTDEEISSAADKCAAFEKSLEQDGIEFLYVAAPQKAYFGDVPADVPEKTNENYDSFVSEISHRGVTYLDLAERMRSAGLCMENAFFITDHHWLPETGLWAAGEIFNELKKVSGFEYDDYVLSPDSYSSVYYDDVFLGSVGKKVGRYYTPLGLDGISIITPKFDTELTVTDYRGTFTGSFEDVLIFKSKLDSSALYTSNPYTAYTGGDFPLQVIENNVADENAQKLVVIRDSYACVVTPFLSLAADSLHIIDTRYWNESMSIPDYIKSIGPDCVIVLCSGVPQTILDFE